MIDFIAAAFASIASGREIAAWLYERLKRNPEEAAKITEMQSILFGLQGNLIDANSKISELSTEIGILKERINYRSKLIRRDAYYEFSEPMEGYGKGPFCLHCTDINEFPVSVPVNSEGHFFCSSCKMQGWLIGKKEEHTAKTRTAKEEQRRKRNERGMDFW